MPKTFVICEKPSACAKIAAALAPRRISQKEKRGVPYYEFELDGKEMVVAPALGHLFTLKNTRPMRDYPVYDVDWVPTHEVDKKARTKAFVEVIKSLASGADDFISACDYDMEGSVIAYNVLYYLCGEGAVDRAKRMRFSTLTTTDLRKAYEDLVPRLDFEMIDAGIARHLLDWLWGINVSKALSASVEASDQRFAKLSAGRVQTPTLKILSEREKLIKAFKPEPFWLLGLLLDLEGTEIVAEHETKRFFDKAEAEKARAASDVKAAKVIEVEARQYRRPPPVPFDLGTLQAEAYRNFGYTPFRTQRLAQDLYQAALISYPRTSSQKLPPSINFEEIIASLGRISPQYGKISKELLSRQRLVPQEGKKTDPAHPAIFPTGETPQNLTGPPQKLYDLIVRRFFSVFGSTALLEGIKVEFDAGGEKFNVRGRRVLEAGWMEYYGRYGATEEVILPPMKKGQKLDVKRVIFEEKETQPPARYNPASIVKEMESKNLGTKATRASILQILYTRQYISGNQINVTDLGLQIVDALEKYCPEILSEELTSRFEGQMESIQEGKVKKEEVVEAAKVELDVILKKFKQYQLEIGKELAEAVRVTRAQQWVVGKCPKCGGDLRIIRSRASGKRFVGCSTYPGCSHSRPLPQVGSVVPLHRECPQCKEPMIQVYRSGRRPYRMCINPDCPSKANWKKKTKTV